MTKKGKKKGDLLYRIVMLFLIAVMLFSLYKIGTMIHGYYQGSSQYEAVQEIAKADKKKDDAIDFDALNFGRCFS